MSLCLKSHGLPPFLSGGRECVVCNRKGLPCGSPFQVQWSANGPLVFRGSPASEPQEHALLESNLQGIGADFGNGQVASGTSIRGILALSANQDIVSGSSDELVIALLTEEDVVAAATVQQV